MTSKLIVTNGLSYFYLKGSSKNHNALVFLPGLGACAENYTEHLTQLKPNYKRLFCLDLPEQGSKGEWTIENMIDNLKEFIILINDEELKRIDLAGHSAGALAVFSFLFDYNYKTENIQSINSKLKDNKKIKRLFLYAPPDLFHTVFHKRLSNCLKNKNERFIKNLLNMLINRPMLFLRYFSKNLHFYFPRNKSNRPNYYKLTISNHYNFFNYISTYNTLFELSKLKPSIFNNIISETLDSKNILIQYGSNDWLLKPMFKRKKELKENLKIHQNIEIKVHQYLGHLLRKKMRLDINLNLQLITNKQVLARTIEFINEH